MLPALLLLLWQETSSSLELHLHCKRGQGLGLDWVQGVIYELARQCFGARVDIKELAVINEDLDMDHEVRSVGCRNAGLVLVRKLPPGKNQLLLTAAGCVIGTCALTLLSSLLQACLISFPTVAKVEERPRPFPAAGDLIGISPEAFYQLNPFREFMHAASSCYGVPVLSV